VLALLHSVAWPGISAFGVSRDRRRHRYRRVTGDHTRLCWRSDRWCVPGPAFCSLCVSVFSVLSLLAACFASLDLGFFFFFFIPVFQSVLGDSVLSSLFSLLMQRQCTCRFHKKNSSNWNIFSTCSFEHL
jgi:hypothetical protein